MYLTRSVKCPFLSVFSGVFSRSKMSGFGGVFDVKCHMSVFTGCSVPTVKCPFLNVFSDVKMSVFRGYLVRSVICPFSGSFRERRVLKCPFYNVDF